MKHNLKLLLFRLGCALAPPLLLLAACPSVSTAAVSWSMVVVPDTQGETIPAPDPTIVNGMMQWIVGNNVARNIQVMLHEGDITSNNLATQWHLAKTAISKLDGEVPYILAPGNHDIGDNGLSADRTTLMNDYFGLSDNSLNNSSTEGIVTVERVAGELENTYSTFTAPDGRNMLIFSLEFGPRQEVVDWANTIASQAQYQDHTAVLLTHAYLEEGPADTNGGPTPLRSDITGPWRFFSPHRYDVAPDVHDGQELWDELVGANGNFEMVLNGHFLDDTDDNINTEPSGLPLTTAYQSDVGTNGNTVHEMVFNAQQSHEGYLRLLGFLDDGKTVQVRTYSTVNDDWLTDDYNEFQFELTQVPEPGTFAMAALALLSLAFCGRRRRRQI